MRNLFLALVVAVQTYYLWGLFGLGMTVITALSKFSGGNAALMAGILSEGIIVSAIRSVLGMVGLVASVIIVFKVGNLPNWFKQVTKYISYVWVIFIPIGTVLGIIQLKRLNSSNA